ncbi:MAG: AIR synthase related protein, partial [Gammaproteobacteria bacterium]|nr:AIR synthase related protein [Gammaproteobacteria bacterium]
MNEFGIIKQYFQRLPVNRPDVILGSGDDCALLSVPPNQLLAVSIDTLISGVHFPIDFSPYNIGYKSLAVNLSDLAAMCAKPAWFTCGLTLVEVNEGWLSEFARGLFDCAKKYNIQLVGGDLT